MLVVLSFLLELFNQNISEVHFASVILDEDVSFGDLSEIGVIPEFALAASLFEVLAKAHVA